MSQDNVEKPLMTISPERQGGEDFKAYKLRLSLYNKAIKHWLKGRGFWDSSNGTYRK